MAATTEPGLLPWLHQGQALGWCSEPFCSTHEPEPLTDDELDAWDHDDPPCVATIRLWDLPGGLPASSSCVDELNRKVADLEAANTALARKLATERARADRLTDQLTALLTPKQ